MAFGRSSYLGAYLELFVACNDNHSPDPSLSTGVGSRNSQTGQHMKLLSKSEEGLHLMLTSIQDLQIQFKADLFRAAASRQFCALPEELLIQILYFSVDVHSVQWETSLCREQLRTLSSVNRRLRNVVSSTPHFWTVLSGDMQKSELKTFIARSGTAPLHIRAEYGEYDHSKDAQDETLNVNMFLQEVVPLCHRWQSFKLSFHSLGEMEDPDWQRVENICQCLSSLCLPLLSSLELRLPPRCQLSDNVGNDRDELHYYLSWDIPSLREFKTRLMMPRVLPNDLSPRLTRCEICLDDGSWQFNDWPLSSLFNFLISQTSLEQLSIYMVNFPQRIDIGSISFLRSHLPIKMHSLRSLVVNAIKLSTRDQYAAYVVPEIVRSLEAPALVTLGVDFPLVNPAFTVDDIFPQHRAYPQLIHLSMAMRYLPFEGFYVHLPLFRRIFEVATNLQHLHINALDADVEDMGLHSVMSAPRLKVLSLINCRYLEVRDVQAILICLQRCSHWQDLELLRVSGCPRIDGQGILALQIEDIQVDFIEQD